MAVFPRRTGIASVAALSGISFGLVLAHVVAPEWIRAAGLDVWNAGAAAVDYRDATDYTNELNAVQDQLDRQIAASEQVVALLGTGEITLTDATTELCEINRGRPGFAEVLVSLHPEVLTHQARVARYALTKLRTQLASDPSRLAEVSARLEAEYRAMVGAPTDARPGQSGPEHGS